MELGLTGKTAIVTGASAGIGLACAKALYQEGVNMVIVARDPQKLEKAVISIQSGTANDTKAKIVSVSGDLQQTETVEKVVKYAQTTFGRIDILVNNAGSASAGAFLELSDETFLQAWNLKLMGYIRMVKAVAPFMIDQQDGRIVNIVGTAGRTPSATFLPASTVNAALLNFTKGISKELAKNNVRINSISPGKTATERAERLEEQQALIKGVSLEAEKSETIKSIPLGRMVDPMEIAAMVLLLVSDRIPSITGSEIVIDGGQQPGV